MKTFYNLDNFFRSTSPSERFIVTIGVFDGVHRAHQKIVKYFVKRAKTRNSSGLLITFDPHPANAFNPSKRVPLLISLAHRLRLLGELGVRYTLVLRFDRRFARMSAAGFIKKILAKIPIDEIIVGENFFFGRNKSGSLKDLKYFSGVYGYKVNFIKTIKSAGRAISSTRIRGLILSGRLKKASELLSRPVTVLGTVVRGERRGRFIGFPTANIDPHHEAIPPSGVYAVRVKLGKKLYNGILNIGFRPTFRRPSLLAKDSTLEAHIFDFNKPIYKREIEVIFVRKIREEKRFRDISRLKAQIEKDEKRARRILG